MPAPRAASVPAKKPRVPPGPELPPSWQPRFLAFYRTHGGAHRAAEAAGVSHETVRRYRHADPAFDQACIDAREYFADQTEERMLASAERSDNPAGYIVRLKALRPAEYIERHAISSLSVNVTAELSGPDAAHLLATMLASATAPTTTLFQRALPATIDGTPPP